MNILIKKLYHSTTTLKGLNKTPPLISNKKMGGDPSMPQEPRHPKSQLLLGSSVAHHKSQPPKAALKRIINFQFSIFNFQSSIINHHSSLITHQSSIVNRHSSLINRHSSIINHQSSLIPPPRRTNYSLNLPPKRYTKFTAACKPSCL